MQQTQGAFAIVLNVEKKKVLLLKRKDAPVWDLPGGRVEESETVEACVKREVFEETGYKVEIERKLGKCTRIRCNDVQHLFLARIIGGEAIIEGSETSCLEWYDINNLPRFMVPNRKKQINDSINSHEYIEVVLRESALKLFIMKKMKDIF